MKINKETLTPISLTVGCVVTAVTGALWLNDAMNERDQRMTERDYKMDAAMQAIGYRLERIEEKVNAADGIRGREMKLWIELVRAKNSAMTLPDFPPADR